MTENIRNHKFWILQWIEAFHLHYHKYHRKSGQNLWLFRLEFFKNSRIMSSRSRGPFLSYVSIFFAFLDPTHPPYQHKYSTERQQNWSFLDPPTQFFCWRNIEMVPSSKVEMRDSKNKVKSQESFICFNPLLQR